MAKVRCHLSLAYRRYTMIILISYSAKNLMIRSKVTAKRSVVAHSRRRARPLPQ